MNTAPLSSFARLVNASLAFTCLALATAVILITSLIVHSGGPGAVTPTASAVSVFADAAAPRSEAAVHGTPAGAASSQSAGAVSLSLTQEGTAARTGAAPSNAQGPAGGAFPDTASPQTPIDPDARSVELGLRFVPKVDGTVSALRFYKTAANQGPHVGTLWGPSGEVLARVQFPAGAESGWQSAEISPAVAVTAGATYVASYLAPSGRYAADEHGFDTGIETATLSIPVGAGVYAYGSGALPTENYRNSNYYVDIAFVAATAPEPTPEPTVDPEPTTSPEPTTTPEPQPTTSPEPSPAGAGGVFAPGTEPEQAVDPDRASVELGMRFVPKHDGRITALRFYRSAVNAGPHVGTLWSAGGAVLARADFPAEGGEGWQTAPLAQPVEVTAGTEYVVSYLAREGLYSADEHYFDVGIENEYFSVPVGAGVYVYGSGALPTENYRNSNYYVDVRFAPETGATPTPSGTASPTAEPTAEPTASPSPTATASPSPTATPTPQPTGGSSVLDLPTEPWWGGSAYYAQWDKAAAAGWTDPSFFPISVFFGKPSHADELAAIGINTFMGAEHDGSPVSTMTREGISLLAQSEWTDAEVGDDPLVVGWHVSDECDMGLSGCASPRGEEGSLEIHKGYVADLRNKADGRFLQANFGNGVLGSYWSPTTMDDHLALVDVSSVDKYAYTSPHVQDLLRDSPFWPEGKNPSSAGAYGWQQDRMESFMSPAASKPNWVFVETAKPFLTESGATTITVDQIRGAVWNGIIHGAAGIAYFQHNNNGCGTYSLLTCGQALRDGVAAVNAQVAELAPVINSPSYAWSFGAGLETALKARGGDAYILAMTDGGTGERTFSLPAGLAGSVEVVGEGRTLTVESGTFTDRFAAESTVHIYRVAIE
jgi:hypothetical protein